MSLIWLSLTAILTAESIPVPAPDQLGPALEMADSGPLGVHTALVDGSDRWLIVLPDIHTCPPLQLRVFTLMESLLQPGEDQVLILREGAAGPFSAADAASATASLPSRRDTAVGAILQGEWGAVEGMAWVRPDLQFRGIEDPNDYRDLWRATRSSTERETQLRLIEQRLRCNPVPRGHRCRRDFLFENALAAAAESDQRLVLWSIGAGHVLAEPAAGARSELRADLLSWAESLQRNVALTVPSRLPEWANVCGRVALSPPSAAADLRVLRRLRFQPDQAEPLLYDLVQGQMPEPLATWLGGSMRQPLRPLFTENPILEPDSAVWGGLRQIDLALTQWLSTIPSRQTVASAMACWQGDQFHLPCPDDVESQRRRQLTAYTWPSWLRLPRGVPELPAFLGRFRMGYDRQGILVEGPPSLPVLPFEARGRSYTRLRLSVSIDRAASDCPWLLLDQPLCASMIVDGSDGVPFLVDWVQRLATVENGITHLDVVSRPQVPKLLRADRRLLVEGSYARQTLLQGLDILSDYDRNLILESRRWVCYRFNRILACGKEDELVFWVVPPGDLNLPLRAEIDQIPATD